MSFILPNTFVYLQNYIDKILVKKLDVFIIIYLDDILICIFIINYIDFIR